MGFKTWLTLRRSTHIHIHICRWVVEAVHVRTCLYRQILLYVSAADTYRLAINNSLNSNLFVSPSQFSFVQFRRLRCLCACVWRHTSEMKKRRSFSFVLFTQSDDEWPCVCVCAVSLPSAVCFCSSFGHFGIPSSPHVRIPFIVFKELLVNNFDFFFVRLVLEPLFIHIRIRFKRCRY